MAGRKILGSGQVCVWPGGTLWIGEATGATDLHAHHAVQISFGWSGDLQFRTSRTWTRFRACLIPNDVSHAFLGDNITAAHVFIEPESTIGKALLERFGHRSIRSLPPDRFEPAATVLFDAWKGARHPARLVPAAQQALALLAGGVAPVATTDPRVLGAIEIIKSRLDGPVTLADVAREVHISPSRLRHLFAEETGLPFRRYVLWQRLQQVFGMMTTATLTDAAHAAGFADAAHMTRTFRRMLGIAPTNLEAE
ncbi:MAG: helix-turn-helix transcriptional regulator [Acidimicrobiia bacterium]|nr:helix-turn-helix transcriptional regulator [Acidimicrobiia bacterium]